MRRVLAAFALLAMTLPAQAQSSEPDLSAIDRAWQETPWTELYETQLDASKPRSFTPPPDSDIPDTEFGRLIRRGLAIFIDTPREASAYVGDGLSCSNCHLDRGRRPGSAPMWSAWISYPQFRTKDNQVNTFAMRIQGCFRFSMNGTPPPAESEIIVALQSYAYFLARGAPTGVKREGAGFPMLVEPEEEPDIARGAAAYVQKCAACHGENGEGRRTSAGNRYQFPPLWGNASYNWGAGMANVDTAAAFIKHNMPWGLTDALADQEAWDIAIYINSRDRPQDPRFTGNVVETRAKFHESRWSLYGLSIDGRVLGSGE
jgi:thiosulfate dehydrogenase